MNWKSLTPGETATWACFGYFRSLTKKVKEGRMNAIPSPLPGTHPLHIS